MPSYLFTSDQRISELPNKIQWVADFLQKGNSISDISDKSANNNASTLLFYYNLYKDTDTGRNAVDNPFYAIRNFVLKFQYPNTRTSESLRDSINEKVFLAPYRSVVSVLCELAELEPKNDIYLSLTEIQYFIFCNPNVYGNPNANYKEIANEVIKSRNNKDSLDIKVSELLKWNQYGRQSSEMMRVLTYASSCFKMKKDSVFFIRNTSDYYKDSDFINKLRTYNLFWFPTQPQNYQLSRNEYISYMDTHNTPFAVYDFNSKINSKNKNNSQSQVDGSFDRKYRQYITAIKSKPFLLLAGISGTGKSRIVRELARACWDKGSDKYEAPKPNNFEMIQVKPNWHDSSELIGYLSNLNGTKYIPGKFLEFVVKAWTDTDTPYFLCLDEMNLAPVEQYFAEYLSVIESRKNCDGEIKTDAIIYPDKVYNGLATVKYMHDSEDNHTNKDSSSWFIKLINELLDKTGIEEEKKDDFRKQFMKDGITLPKNLIVVGTVNMDETTFSFSRKVLDRAMTIEMNEFNLYGGLEEKHENIGKLSKQELIGDAVEGSDVYDSYKEVCDIALEYLKIINEKLENTPFKVAYRTRNEMLLYVVNNLPYNKNNDGSDIPREIIIARALDEITNMKILSRIEGDETKVNSKLLDSLSNTIKLELNKISGKEYSESKANTQESEIIYSVSMGKISEMKKRLETGYTSFWN